MVATHTPGRAVATRKVVLTGVLLVAFGAGTGLLLGLALVEVLGVLGLHVDAGAWGLLHRAFVP